MNIEEFNRSKQQKQIERQAFWEKQKKYQKQYNKGELVIPQILWHLNDSDIDLNLQSSKIITGLVEQGFTVLPDVDIEKLFDEMTEGNAEFYRRKTLDMTESSFTSILNHWYDGQKLIPPTIMIFDDHYIKKHCRGGLTSKELQPIDGKHRLSLSYWAGVKTLPILVLKRQKDLIKARLGL